GSSRAAQFGVNKASKPLNAPSSVKAIPTKTRNMTTKIGMPIAEAIPIPRRTPSPNTISTATQIASIGQKTPGTMVKSKDGVSDICRYSSKKNAFASSPQASVEEKKM